VLRRSKTIVFREDTDPQDPPSALPRRPERRGLEALRTAPRPAAAPPPVDEEPAVNAPQQRLERLRSELDEHPISKGSPRSLEALRSEFQKGLASYAEEGPAYVAPARVVDATRILRIALVAVALLAGGLAAFLATQFNRAPEPVVAAEPAPAPEPVPTVQVLVAGEPIGVGRRLLPELLHWQDWPESGLRPEYITSAAEPEAIAGLGANVARSPIAPGEPILRQKLGTAGEGFLSGILESGKRGVSVGVSPETASGGFIVPNDRVDVVLTRQMQNGERASQTILTNVRVIAIGGQLGAGELPADNADAPGAFSERAIATLELDSVQSELLINATTTGSLSLVLRPTADAGQTLDSERDAVNQAIRLTSPFWQTGKAGP
jgi:pilus assembly protein CpaB